jgi:hypothetical protein
VPFSEERYVRGLLIVDSVLHFRQQQQTTTAEGSATVVTSGDWYHGQ